MNLKQILLTYFGIESLRDMQQPAISRLLAGENTLCLMPTGSGKSLIFQATGVALGTTTLVISPLLALMGQQRERLSAQKLTVLAYNSALGDTRAQTMALKEFFKTANQPRFLYVSPEKLLHDGFLEYVLRRHRQDIGLVVVDEAHCVSQWGHEFRPSYKFIPQCLDNIFGTTQHPPLLALTATLSAQDLSEVCHDFQIPKNGVLRSPKTVRDNITMVIEPVLPNDQAKEARLREILEKHRGEKVIVYTHIKKRRYGTRRMAEAFSADFGARPFDADLADIEKRDTLRAFEQGEVRVIFATGAFGMGIDIPDIRVVVHYLLPESIEQYCQEIGRAGRDDQPSFAYLLHTPANIRVREDLIQQSASAELLADLFSKHILPKNYRQDDPTRYLMYDWVDAGEEDQLPQLFFQLQQSGLTTLPLSCLQFVDCLEEKEADVDFQKYKIVSEITEIVARRTGDPLAVIAEKIYAGLYEDRLKLKKQLKQVLYFRLVQMLESSHFEKMAARMNDRTEIRLQNFRQFQQFLTLDSDEQTKYLNQYFNAQAEISL